MDKKLVTIHTKESLLVTKNPLIPYTETSKDAIEAPFQAFEIALASYVVENSSILRPTLLKASNMMTKVMLKGKYQAGKGLEV